MSETQPAGHYPKGYCGGCSLDIVVVSVSSAVFSFWLLGNIFMMIDKVSNIKATILLSVCVCEQRVTTESVLCLSCDTFCAQLCHLWSYHSGKPCNLVQPFCKSTMKCHLPEHGGTICGEISQRILWLGIHATFDYYSSSVKGQKKLSRNQTLFHCVFQHVTTFKALQHRTSVKGRAQTCYIDLSGIHASSLRI